MGVGACAGGYRQLVSILNSCLHYFFGHCYGPVYCASKPKVATHTSLSGDLYYIDVAFTLYCHTRKPLDHSLNSITT